MTLIFSAQLHYVHVCIYVPRLNDSLDGICEVWNHHSLSTENNWSPPQLFTAFSVDSPLFHEIDPHTYGLSDGDDQSDIEDERDEQVNVPHMQSPLNDTQMNTLTSLVDPLEQSTSFGADIFMKTVVQVGLLLHDGDDDNNQG